MQDQNYNKIIRDIVCLISVKYFPYKWKELSSYYIEFFEFDPNKALSIKYFEVGLYISNMFYTTMKNFDQKNKYNANFEEFKTYFTNAYINRVIRNYSLDKLNVYLSQKKKGRKLENDNPKDENDDNKIFDASILETIENYSRTMIQGPKNEKFPLLIPFEIFKKCEHTNKKIEELPKKEQKSIITFSESEISYISKNVIDKSLIEVIKDLSEKHKNQKNYKELVNLNNNAHNTLLNYYTKYMYKCEYFTKN